MSRQAANDSEGRRSLQIQADMCPLRGGGEQQDPDLVEKGSKFQIVQLACSQIEHLSDQQRDRSGPPAMASLPGECTIDFFADLPHEDAFDVTA